MLKKNTNDIIILLKYGDIMKRIKNQKGFTLIELLAVIIILAVIMTVAIPNIVGTLDKNKKDSFIKDAKRAITSCEYTIRTEKKYEYPDETTAVIFPLSKIKNLELEVSSFDTYYSQEDSFVAITKDKANNTGAYEYVYYVHLVSCTDELCENLEDNSSLKNRGINLERADALDAAGKYDLVVKGEEVNLLYLRDENSQYDRIKAQLSAIRARDTKVQQLAVTNVVVYK